MKDKSTVLDWQDKMSAVKKVHCIKKGFIHQYGQEEELRQTVISIHKVNTVLRQSWKDVNLSFNNCLQNDHNSNKLLELQQHKKYV